MRVPAMTGDDVVSGLECFLFAAGSTPGDIVPGCCAARKRCAADPGPMLYASLWVPGAAEQRDGTMLRIAGRTLHRVRDTGILWPYASSDPSPSGRSNSTVFSVIETMVY